MRPRRGVSHKKRPQIRRGWAVHVTLRVREHVWNLRNPRRFEVIANALAAVKEGGSLRVVHFAVLGNHIHLIVETVDAISLARGVSAFMIRVAKGLNRLMSCRGRVFEDHYHSHPLSTPTETARAIRWVLGNFARHAACRGEQVDAQEPDPFSSARHANSALTSPPATWLLRAGWRRAAAAAA
jgi:REP element-mobilizing transposase RayT